jgi:hypothetical protein
LGYIEVATLKKKWEAGEVNPVSALGFLFFVFRVSGGNPQKLNVPY